MSKPSSASEDELSWARAAVLIFGGMAASSPSLSEEGFTHAYLRMAYDGEPGDALRSAMACGWVASAGRGYSLTTNGAEEFRRLRAAQSAAAADEGRVWFQGFGYTLRSDHPQLLGCGAFALAGAAIVAALYGLATGLRWLTGGN